MDICASDYFLSRNSESHIQLKTCTGSSRSFQLTLKSLFLKSPKDRTAHAAEPASKQKQIFHFILRKNKHAGFKEKRWCTVLFRLPSTSTTKAGKGLNPSLPHTSVRPTPRPLHCCCGAGGGNGYGAWPGVGWDPQHP